MNWELLKYFVRDDFKNPEQMNPEIIFGVDALAEDIGVKPLIISDYRSGDRGQHGQGNAIDTTWPGIDPLIVNERALKLKLFTGIGIYVNEKGIASHHCDVRANRTVDNPARWGGIITHPAGIKRIEYVSMEHVIDIIKKKKARK